MKTIEERAEELYKYSPNDNIEIPSYLKGRQEERAEWEEKTRWIPVEEKNPKAKRKVLVKIVNSLGNEHTLSAQYIPPKTVLASDFNLEDDSGCDEYDEEIDDFWTIEGWLEYQYEADINWHITDIVTHWKEII